MGKPELTITPKKQTKKYTYTAGELETEGTLGGHHTDRSNERTKTRGRAET